jgi:hypothetical protein
VSALVLAASLALEKRPDLAPSREHPIERREREQREHGLSFLSCGDVNGIFSNVR